MQHESILIIDFGSQYTQLIARRVREANVYSKVVSCEYDATSIAQMKPKGIILSGGPDSVFDADAPKVDPKLFDLGLPILGICYGMQIMAQTLGGVVEKAAISEYGHAEVELVRTSLLTQDTPRGAKLPVWMSHGDHLSALPDGFDCLGATSDAPICMMGDDTRHLYGLQFHPEVTHTQDGKLIIESFLFDVCQCAKDWTFDTIIEEQIELIQAQVNDQNVVLGLSGGVDSSVVAALMNRAIGQQLFCVFVDTGLLRYQEGEQVIAAAQDLNIQLIHVDAKEIFFEALKGVSCPEAKRKIIGAKFIEIFEQEANKLENVSFLAQGTIYPDVIESAGIGKKAKVIKSHHNVGGLPETMNLELIEPLNQLFKDEVRAIGEQLGLPKAMIYRHPFPGPGLGVRVLGEVKPEYVSLLQKADKVFMDLLHEFDYYDKVSQAFAVFLPVKSVGVTGDNRRYEYVVALRAVETTDFMTARSARLPYELLEKASRQIINSIDGISRVTYDISSKPPATIEWE